MLVLTGGKFNRIHEGHKWLLRRARRLGTLVVVLAHDSHNKRSYAKPAAERLASVKALGIADEVVVGDADDFFLVVERYAPDIIVLGYDQQLPFTRKRLDEWEKRAGKKVRIVRFEKHGEYSSAGL